MYKDNPENKLKNIKRALRVTVKLRKYLKFQKTQPIIFIAKIPSSFWRCHDNCNCDSSIVVL